MSAPTPRNKSLKGVLAISDDTIIFTPVSALAGLIRAKKLSPVELVKAFLQRINEINSKLNAYLTIAADEAMASAQRAETAVIRLWDKHELSLNKTDKCAVC